MRKVWAYCGLSGGRWRGWRCCRSRRCRGCSDGCGRCGSGGRCGSRCDGCASDVGFWCFNNRRVGFRCFVALAKIGYIPAATFELKASRCHLLAESFLIARGASGQRGSAKFLQCIFGKAAGAASVGVNWHKLAMKKKPVKKIAIKINELLF